MYNWMRNGKACSLTVLARKSFLDWRTMYLSTECPLGLGLCSEDKASKAVVLLVVVSCFSIHLCWICMQHFFTTGSLQHKALKWDRFSLNGWNLSVWNERGVDERGKILLLQVPLQPDAILTFIEIKAGWRRLIIYAFDFACVQTARLNAH